MKENAVPPYFPASNKPELEGQVVGVAGVDLLHISSMISEIDLPEKIYSVSYFFWDASSFVCCDCS